MLQASTIIYDNRCKLCNSAIRFLKSKNGSDGLVFYASAGEDSEHLIRKYKIPGELTEKTVILIDNERVYIKSTAIIRALQKKGRFWRLAGIFLIVPAFLRDTIYDLVATNRGKEKVL